MGSHICRLVFLISSGKFSVPFSAPLLQSLPSETMIKHVKLPNETFPSLYFPIFSYLCCILDFTHTFQFTKPLFTCVTICYQIHLCIFQAFFFLFHKNTWWFNMWSLYGSAHFRFPVIIALFPYVLNYLCLLVAKVT